MSSRAIARVRREGEGQDDRPASGRATILIVGTQRNGPTGEIPVVFLKPHAKLENKTPESYSGDDYSSTIPYSS